MLLTIAIFSVFLFSVQGIEINPDNNLEAEVYLKDHKRFLSEMNGWMSGSTKNMKAQVEETTQDFQELPNTLVENAKQQLQLHYAQSMKELTGSSAPQHCIAAGHLELMQLKANNIKGFFGCKNLTEGVQDIVKMGLEISKLTVQILITTDEILNGFDSCKSWNVFKFIYCSFKWVKDSLSDIYKSFEAVTTFNKNIAYLITDLKNQIEYCLHGSKAAALMHHVQVLSNVQQCAAKAR